MRVLIIPEDFTKDQYMLKPIVEAMLQSIGKPKAVVRACQDPRFQGISQVLDGARFQPVIERYKGMIDLFLICVDRDGQETRHLQLDNLVQQASAIAPGRIVLAENAWQEIEVWVLAGHNLPEEWSWAAIRQELHPKENYYLLFAAQRGVLDQSAEGRKTLAAEAAQRYSRIRQLCPEDVAGLEERIGQAITAAYACIGDAV